MIDYHARATSLYRYDLPEISTRVLGGSIRVSTLQACRVAENPNAADSGEGHKTVTSLPGVDHPEAASFARLLGVDPSSVSISGNGVVLVGTGAVHRTEVVEAYVFCTSALNAPFLRARFGGGCVRIIEPSTFFAAVDLALRAAAPGPLGPCLVDDVEYGPRENNYRDHTDRHPAFLKPSGPPRHFESEAEVRAIWQPQGFTPEPLCLQVPSLIPLLELVTSP